MSTPDRPHRKHPAANPRAAAARADLTFDERSERNLKTLLPPVQALARLFLRTVQPAMQRKGVVVRIISGTRTYAEQDALYAKGRTRPGPKVTNAQGGFSNHNF